MDAWRAPRVLSAGSFRSENLKCNQEREWNRLSNSLAWNEAEADKSDVCATSAFFVERGNGVRIEVYAQGQGDLLVMLPSLGRGAVDMEEISTPLAAAGYRVLRPEPRGNGRSVGPLEDKTLHDWAEDIAAVVESQNAGPAFILGHAHGNWIARTLASDRPDLVRALLLLAGSAGKVPEGFEGLPISHETRAVIERCGDTSLPTDVRLRSLQEVFLRRAMTPVYG